MLANFVRNWNVNLVLQNYSSGGESTSARLSREELVTLKVIVQAKLSRVMLKDVECLLSSPNDFCSVGLKKEVSAVYAYAFSQGDETAISFQRGFILPYG